MPRTEPVRKPAKLTLEHEIAHLRDLDLHGLRARWKAMFKRQPSPHLPRHLLFAILAYRLQANELGGLRKGLKLVRGMHHSLTEDEHKRVADAIAEHLRLSNWRIEKEPSAGWAECESFH